MDEFRVAEEYQTGNLQWQINCAFSEGYELWKLLHIPSYQGYAERFIMIFRKIKELKVETGLP